MLKKITAILLSITLLLTLSPVTGVFATSNVTNGTLTENFDGMSVTNDYFIFKNSKLDGHEFFTRYYAETDTFNRNDPAYKIVEKKGADGKVSRMLEMISPVYTTSKTPVALALPSFTVDDYNAGKLLKYSCDFYIEKIPTDSSEFVATEPYLAMFYYNTSGTLASNSVSFNSENFVITNSYNKSVDKGAKLEAGNWYRVEMSAGGDEGSYLNCSIYDKSGTKIYTKTSTETGPLDIFTNTSRTNAKGHDRLLASAVLLPVNTANAGFTVLIDNAEYRVCLPAEAGPAIKTGSTFTEASIKNGDTVELNVGEATVAFDQRLADGAKATLTPSGGTPIECTMTAGKTYASSSFYTVTIPELTAGTDYTLSFENCKNSKNQPCGDSITFKTAGASSEKAEVSNVNYTGVASGEKITFDYLAKEAGETVFIAAFYDKTEDKNLVGVEILIKNDVVAGENKITITLENDYSDDAQNFVIYTWNNLKDITPLTDTVNTPIN